MNCFGNQHGLTLLELLFCLVILGATLTVALPSLQSFQLRLQARSDIAQLHQAISGLRQQALHHHNRATLCPMINDQCKSDWNAELVAFLDHNDNRKRDSDEPVIFSVPKARGKSFRHFNSNVISFNAQGFAGANNGTFTYCLPNDPPLASVLIISRNGRLRMGVDQNNDGLPETPDGKNVQCGL